MKKEIYISKGVGETRIAVKENGKLADVDFFLHLYTPH